MVLRSSDGGGGGTYGGSPSNDPLALTGQTANGMAGELLTYKPPGIASQNAMPTDLVHLDPRSMGYAPNKGQGMGVRPYGDVTYGQAQTLPGQWFSNDQGLYKQFVNKLVMYKFPGATGDVGIPEAMSSWDNLLQMSITLNKASGGKGKQWTPWDVLETYNHKPGTTGTHRSGDWLIDNATGEHVKYVGPRTKTTKQSAIDLSNPEQVQAIATDTLTKMIGRAPTDKELAQFKATLNGYEKSNPETSVTTEHLNDQGEVVKSDVVHSGGVTDAARATVLGEGVKKTKEYGKYQGGTTYFNALMSMIGGG